MTEVPGRPRDQLAAALIATVRPWRCSDDD